MNKEELRSRTKRFALRVMSVVNAHGRQSALGNQKDSNSDRGYIMPQHFEFPARTDLWVPVGLNPQSPNEFWHLNPIARLQPGITKSDADRAVKALMEEYAELRKWPKQEPADYAVMVTIPLIQRLVHDVQTPLLVLLGAVGLVLLIACANIANLLLARAGMRLALGGIAVGLLGALWLTSFLKSLLFNVKPDGPVDLYRGRVDACRGRFCGVLSAGPPRDARRSDDSLALRVSQNLRLPISDWRLQRIRANPPNQRHPWSMRHWQADSDELIDHGFRGFGGLARIRCNRQSHIGNRKYD